uniref:Integrase core domain containing protein n=1 Tax=Solanum tuberosum TaxID=4113 RepID=M1DAT6_SOLTU
MVCCRGLQRPSTVRRLTHGPWMVSVDPRYDGTQEASHLLKTGDSGVPIWHCDKLVHPTGALGICLIRDEENVAAPRREPQIEVPPLGTDLADIVGQAHGGDPFIPDHADTVPGSSSQEASMAPSSSRSTPQLGATVVPTHFPIIYYVGSGPSLDMCTST